MLAAGDHAPAFSLPDLNGSQHSLQEMLQRGPVLVALYKVSCPVCHLALPYLQRISTGGLQIVAISQDGAAATALFMKTFGVSMLTLLDTYESGYPVSNAFGVDQVPALFLIETGGAISFAGSGFRKTEFEEVAMRAGTLIFRTDEHVPAWKPGCGAKN
jgi:peroxiredoxin